MARTPHSFLGVAATVAVAALATFGEATANHFILPCDDTCKSAQWTVTGSLNVPRTGHTATLLADGRVLVVGGASSTQSDIALASAEIYDPATGAWSLTAPMDAPRTGHTATRLADGRVLIAGGVSAGPEFQSWPRIESPALASTEIFDPATQSWTPAGAMRFARALHSAIGLEDGSVLVTAGEVRHLVPTDDFAELYDAETGTWRELPGNPGGCWDRCRGYTLARLDDGRVLIANGAPQIYDPRTGEWRFPGELFVRTIQLPGPASWSHHYIGPEITSDQTASLLRDGTVLFAGSWIPRGSAWRFDAASETWSVAPDLLGPRVYHTATTLANGHVLVAGGIYQTGLDSDARFPTLASSERFDPSSERWDRGPNLNFARVDHTATLLADGRVLVAGGQVINDDGRGGGTILGSAEVYGEPIAARRVVGPDDAARGSRRAP